MENGPRVAKWYTFFESQLRDYLFYQKASFLPLITIAFCSITKFLVFSKNHYLHFLAKVGLS